MNQLRNGPSPGRQTCLRIIDEEGLSVQVALEPRPEDEKEAVLGKRGKGPRGAETPCKGPEAGGLAGSRATGRSVWLGQSEQRAADTRPEVPGLCGSLGCGRGARKGARMRGALTRPPLVPPSRSSAKCCVSVCLADSPGPLRGGWDLSPALQTRKLGLREPKRPARVTVGQDRDCSVAPPGVEAGPRAPPHGQQGRREQLSALGVAGPVPLPPAVPPAAPSHGPLQGG